AAEQPLFGASAQENDAISTPQHEGRATPQLTMQLWGLARKHLRTAETARRATLRPRAEHAGRLFRRANARAQIHQRLCKVAPPPRRKRPSRDPPNLPLGRG